MSYNMSYMEQAIEDLENGLISPSEFVSVSFSEHSSSCEPVFDHISRRSRELERDLRSAVCVNSDELLSNATDVKFLRDNVTLLKTRVARCREEAKVVASKLLNPFREIEKAAVELNSSSIMCRKLRALQRFLSLARQAQGRVVPEKITSATNDIRKWCEIQRIADAGDLDNIIVFQNVWATVQPQCTKLVALAETQLATALDHGDAMTAAPAAAVFLNLGTSESVAVRYFGRITSEMAVTSRANMRKLSQDTIVACLRTDITSMCEQLKRVGTLHQAFETACSKCSELEVTCIDTDVISPTTAVRNYADMLRDIVAAVVQTHDLSGVVTAEIPEIRQCMLQAVMHVPSGVDKSWAFVTVMSAFGSFQELFVGRIGAEVQTRLFNFFGKDMRNVESKQIALFFEQLRNNFVKYDRELLAKLKPGLVKLARRFKKLRECNKPELKAAAIRHNAVVCEGFRSIGSVFGQDSQSQDSWFIM